MTQNPANQYLRTKVMTATPEQLQMLLYDGAVRFMEQARKPLEAKDYEQSYELITRAQRIINELASTLRHEVAPELCKNLDAIYNFCYMRLVDANCIHDPQALDEALQIMKYQRETWSLLLADLGKNKAAKVAQTLPMPEPSDRMEQSICVQG